MQSYIKTISLILDCGVSGKVKGSKFGNEDFFFRKWVPAVNRFQPIFESVESGWYPVLVWFIEFIFPFIGPFIYFIVSCVYMYDYSA